MPFKTSERRLLWREANRHRVSLWRKNNRDKIKEYQRRWRRNNTDKRREYQKQWKADHPEYFRQWKAKSEAALRVLRAFGIEPEGDRSTKISIAVMAMKELGINLNEEV